MTMYDIHHYLPETASLTLLLVEDDAQTRALTAELLAPLFGHVVTAADGEEALQIYDTHKIDIVLTDYRMPRMDGFALTGRLRQIDPDLPVMMITAHSDSNCFTRAIENGIDAYLVKPFSLQQFLSQLGKILSALRHRTEAARNLNILRQYRQIVDSSAILSKTDPNGIIIYVNDAFCEISGYAREELIGRSHNIVRHPEEPSDLFAGIWQQIAHKKQAWQGVIRNRRKDGSAYFVKAAINPILDEAGHITEYISLQSDITLLMNQQRTFEKSIDSLREPVVVYIKLEDFSTLEDFYDTHTINQIQKRVRSFLEAEARREEIAHGKIYQLRYGEYAFAFERGMLPDGDIDRFTHQLRAFQQKIRDRIIQVREVQYQIALLISIAYEREHILESARIGIKKLSELKRDFIVANDFAHLEKLSARKNLETISIIKKALHRNDIVSYFQPIVDNRDRKITRYESLVRLIDGNAVLSPGEFLEVSKKGRYYFDITRIVLQNSFTALRERGIEVAINLSLKDLQSHGIRRGILALLEKHSDLASGITFELLEDAQIRDISAIKQFIRSIKHHGVKIAIDDFGSGYSNYERLLSYRPDILKIDGSLIRNLDKNSYSRAIVKSIVSFARDQHIKTTAEFVENETIYEHVRALGIDYSQGYFFGKPQPI